MNPGLLFDWNLLALLIVGALFGIYLFPILDWVGALVRWACHKIGVKID